MPIDLAMLAILSLSLVLGAYFYGKLQGLVASDKAKSSEITGLKLENAALLNRLTLKEGSAPIFDEKGNIVITPPGYTSNPVMTILRPPFAQAEHDWEQEEIENRPPAMSDLGSVFVSDLSEAEKERLRNTYGTNGHSYKP
jgi:hypothetical protein